MVLVTVQLYYSVCVSKAVVSTYDGNCSHYDGVCSAYLNMFNTNNITMSYNDIQEEKILELLRNFSSLASEKCSALVLPFICQYVYPPCDDNGSPLLITQEQCVNIRDDVCANEWRITMAMEQGSLLPVCEEFGGENNSVISDTLPCHYQFDNFCGLCLPLCRKFSQYRVQTKLSVRGITIFSFALELVGGTLVLMAAIIRRKQL